MNNLLAKKESKIKKKAWNKKDFLFLLTVYESNQIMIFNEKQKINIKPKLNLSSKKEIQFVIMSKLQHYY